MRLWASRQGVPLASGVIAGQRPRDMSRSAEDAITQRMSDTGDLITHVSDTARWTALHRATESARSDALFSDPLAKRLAGEHGRAIVAGVPRTTRSGWCWSRAPRSSTMPLP